MAEVETVRGPVDVESMGPVLMHEHLFTLGTELRQNYPDYPDPWDEERRVADAVAKLRECASRGIRTIVDPTVLGLGRYIPRVQRINEQVDINIVVATGIYTYHDEPMQFHFTGPGRVFDMPEPMVELFVTDIRDGIAGTAVKAGLLKCAIDEHGLTPGVERVLRAVGQAHVETGTPVTVHTSAHLRTGLIAQKILQEEGVDLSTVVIGHCGDTADLDYLREIANAGSILGMDRFGIDVFLPFEEPGQHRRRARPRRVRRPHGARPRLLVLQRPLSRAAPHGAAAQVDSRPHQRRCPACLAGARRHRGSDHHDAGR